MSVFNPLLRTRVIGQPHLLFLSILILGLSTFADAQTLFDPSRQREIPVDIRSAKHQNQCSVKTPCPVAFISAGYGVPHTQYQFLSRLFSDQGYLVVAIGHELPTDPPLAVTGKFIETRAENWIRGSQTLTFVKTALAPRYPAYNFDRITLVGHSNGGDVSTWLVSESPEYIEALITLDHRRVPLPRVHGVKMLSIRASDFRADEGVLPSDTEKQTFDMCIVTLPDARHNDLSDYGPKSLLIQISMIIDKWLDQTVCHV